MAISNDLILRVMLFVLGVAGFLVAGYIYRKKKKGERLICPAGFDCEAVVKSNFSHVFGIPLEVYGLIYYAIMSAAYLILIFLSGTFLPAILALLLIIAPLLAFLFSLYLLFVQIFILKKGCTWCYLASFISILIFLLTWVIYF